MTAPRPSLAVCPGTFDPVTLGHLDILRRGLALFDRVIVLIAVNPRKQPMFTVDERRGFIETALGAEAARIEVAVDAGLLVDFCVARGARAILRGVRGAPDLDYEAPFTQMNRRLAPTLDTVFLLTDEHHGPVSSSLAKEVARLGGDVSSLVPPAVAAALRARAERDAH